MKNLIMILLLFILMIAPVLAETIPSELAVLDMPTDEIKDELNRHQQDIQRITDVLSGNEQFMQEQVFLITDSSVDVKDARSVEVQQKGDVQKEDVSDITLDIRDVTEIVLDGRDVFKVKVAKQKKFLGLIKMEMLETFIVDAETGDVVYKKRWYDFLFKETQ